MTTTTLMEHDLDFQELHRRVRADFIEMPGLMLTYEQAVRLWACHPVVCRAVLEALASSWRRRSGYAAASSCGVIANLRRPVFETSFEKRRLRVLNSLLRTPDRLNVSVSIDGREARTLVAHVGDFSVGFAIDGVSVKTASTQPKGVSGPMRCQRMALCGGDQPIETWADVEGQPLEIRLGDIAFAVVVDG